MRPVLTCLQLAWRRSPLLPLPRNLGSRPRAGSGRAALERGLIHCQGRTPEATMASALYTDVKRKGERSTFTRCALARAPRPACRRARAAALAPPCHKRQLLPQA